ncbi:hypothetical protein AN958_01127 [Leucoagaricus sp. SymC.cos]|nr:hypothetical protein AN958_01127 [Leucoagaricus sp. SymC.cos]
MSRIPVPASRNTSTSPTPYSDRPISPFPTKTTPAKSSTGHSSMSALSGYQSNVSLSEHRKKQSRRDEAIRKKIESELSRKRTISTTHQSSRKHRGKPSAAKGTVAALKPSPALTVPENISVAEASQLCAAKRTDCVLVVDDEEGLSGIFTAKDLAYRVTAESLDPHSTPVSQIMTRSPMVTRDTTSATEALQLMVSRHFRHLPVCNEDGNVVGLLDITKVFHEALDKVERSSAASEQLFTAMAGVQSELGAVGTNPQAAAMLAWAEKLKQKTALPDLTTVMDSRTTPATVGPKASVRDVAKLMKERRTTAVCVVEAGRIAGIFTSKDVVLRVIAAGLEANRCSVVRVMTPHPDTAPPTMTVHDALKKMHNGHYLNLPVVEEDGHLVAIVDVLKLTYATLEQMNTVAGGDSTGEAEGGPMWGKFFDSIGHDDNDSMLSGSHAPSRSHFSIGDHSHLQQSPHSDLHPNDSASVMDDDDHESVLSGLVRKKGVSVPSGSPEQEGASHPDPNDFHLSYTDADGDTVLITSDDDVTDAVKIARTADQDRVVLYVQGGKGWKEAGADKSEEKAKEVTEEAKAEEKEVERSETTVTPPEKQVPPAYVPPPVAAPAPVEEVFGIPKDLLLPASIGALAVVIIGVFTISRLSSNNY